MIQITHKIATAIATSALLLQAVAPLAYAETTVTLSGNGSSSDNDANVSQNNTTNVVQTNNANVSNYVSGTASTGGNDANDNTGGDVAIRTGDAQSSVNVSNTLNKNVADVNSCNCEGDTTVTIEGNGSRSDNDVRLYKNSDINVFQTNNASVYNSVDADAKTGDNDANRNTGGDTTIYTGDASTNVSVSTTANANLARVGGGNGNGGEVNAIIDGNGSYSDNDIYLNLDRDITLVQDNYAWVYNWVDANANTGYNDANDNTGGDVAIRTGDAQAWVGVDNLVNFNSADVDCGCVFDGKFKIEGNGYDSDNDIRAHLNDTQNLFQDNYNWTDNYVDAHAKTGDNDARRNTGPVHSPDPVVIITGDANQGVSVQTTANKNVIGSDSFHLPDGVEFDFDFNGLWDWWFLHIGGSHSSS